MDKCDCAGLEGRAGRAWKYQWVRGARVCIYHLLSAAFGQGIAVAQVVDLDVFNVVTILLVDLNVEGTTIGGSRGRLCRARGDTGRVCLGGFGQRVVPLTSLHFTRWGRSGPYCTNRRDIDMLRRLLLAQLGVDTRRGFSCRSCRIPPGS